jgi:hypothetical protein
MLLIPDFGVKCTRLIYYKEEFHIKAKFSTVNYVQILRKMYLLISQSNLSVCLYETEKCLLVLLCQSKH